MTDTLVEEAPLISHARRELAAAGMFNKSSDYGGMLGPAVMKLIEALSGQGHSGQSAQITLHLFMRLANHENLTPLTNDPAEWIDRSEMSGIPFWQSSRRSEAFSTDGGMTYWLLSDDPKVTYTSAIQE